MLWAGADGHWPGPVHGRTFKLVVGPEKPQARPACRLGEQQACTPRKQGQLCHSASRGAGRAFSQSWGPGLAGHAGVFCSAGTAVLCGRAPCRHLLPWDSTPSASLTTCQHVGVLGNSVGEHRNRWMPECKCSFCVLDCKDTWCLAGGRGVCVIGARGLQDG